MSLDPALRGLRPARWVSPANVAPPLGLISRPVSALVSVTNEVNVPLELYLKKKKLPHLYPRSWWCVCAATTNR